MKYIIIALCALTSFAYATVREQIKIAGSGTVYPFAIVIAETFAKLNNLKTPTVEAIGSGAGLKMFCGGVGFKHPDIANASRKITPAELVLCSSNGIKNPIEINFGYDAISVVYPKSLGKVQLSTKELFLALAQEVPNKEGKIVPNFYKTWADINPTLPNTPIKVIGPMAGSGTRDTFLELVMDAGCSLIPEIKNLSNKKQKKRICNNIRTDNAWMTLGDNYILVLKKVQDSKDTFGILGYSFFEQNKNKVNAVTINGVEPNTATLKNKTYPLFRPLFMYVKKEHLKLVKNLPDYINYIVSSKVMGTNSYLIKKGLLTLDKKEYNQVSIQVKAALKTK